MSKTHYGWAGRESDMPASAAYPGAYKLTPCGQHPEFVASTLDWRQVTCLGCLKSPYAKLLLLFVWEDVFAGYWDGIAFALAHDADEARHLIAAERGDPDGPTATLYHSALRELNVRPTAVIRLDENTVPRGWALCGGD